MNSANEKSLPWVSHLVMVAKLVCLEDPKSSDGRNLSLVCSIMLDCLRGRGPTKDWLVLQVGGLVWG